MMSKCPSQKVIDRVIIFSLGVLLFSLFLLALTPPYSRDALIHHLAIPKLWVKSGGFYETPWAPFSYYPMNIELIYLTCLTMGSDILPKIVHLLFAIGTGLIIYAYLKTKLGGTYALLGFLLWLSTPIVVYVGTIAYVDIGLTFFVTAALYFMIRFWDVGFAEKKFLVLSSLFAGLALGSKYTGLIAFPFLAAVLFINVSRRSGTWRALKCTIFFIVFASILASPWYVKNYFLTGNPMYPFSTPFSHRTEKNVHLSGTLPPELFVEHRELGSSTMLERRVRFAENAVEILTIPFRIFWQGKDNSAQFFDGVLNPIYLIFMPFVLLGGREDKQWLLFFLFAWFFILTVFFLRSMRIRYILPALPALVILCAFGMRNVLHRTPAIVGSVVALFIIGLLGMNFHYLFVERLNVVKPWRYIGHVETRNEFLSRLVGSYRPIQWMNESLPENARILFLMVGHRGYYCEREYLLAPNFGQGILDEMVKQGGKTAFREVLKNLGATHLFTNHYLVFKYLRSSHSKKEIKALRANMRAVAEVIYDEGPYSVLKLR